MANPNNALGTNAAYGGRTTPEAFNDVLAAFSGRGVLSGWEVQPNSGMSIVCGGNGNTRDVAIAEDNAGNKTTINNISQSPVSLILSAAPVTGSRIDSIVAYVINPPNGSAQIKDNYEAVGLVIVSGQVSDSPAPPDNTAIRSAISNDGVDGTNAYYTILGNITIGAGTTTIISDQISQGPRAIIKNSSIEFPTVDSSLSTSSTNAVENQAIANEFEKVPYVGQTLSTPTDVAYVATANIQNDAVTPEKASFTTYSTSEQAVGTWTDGKPLYRKVIPFSQSVASGANALSTDVSSLNVDKAIKMDFNLSTTTGNSTFSQNYYMSTTNYIVVFYRSGTIQLRVNFGGADTLSGSIIFYYTKTTD